MNGAKALVKSLEDLGVKRIFGYIGSAIAPVFHELGKSSIDITINSNEQSAAFSAAGYSRSTNQVGVAIVTSGPAITNTLTAVADSFCDSIPLLVFSGQVPEHKVGTDAFQHISVRDIFAGACKRVEMITNGDLERIIKDSYFYAKSGKPGPVVVDIPLDKQNCVVPYHGLDIDRFGRIYEENGDLSENKCREFFQLIKRCKNPLLYIGGGLNSERGSRAIRELNNILNIPFVNTLMAKGVMDENDPLSLGMLGMFGTPYANMVVQETDFFLAVGVRWDDRVADKVGSFGPKAEIAYIDINPDKVRQIRAERNLAFSFIGDAPAALEYFVEYAKTHDITLDIQSWRERAMDLKRRWPLDYNRDSRYIQQAEVLELLNSYINGHDIKVTTGVGNHQMYAAQYLQMTRPKSFMTSGSFGTMGFALPVAVGVYFAHPNSTVISIDGDSSLKMNMGELHTIGNYGIPIKVLLLNNYGDGMVRNLQDVLYVGNGQNHIGTVRESDMNFANVARDLGFRYARRVTERENLQQALQEWLSSQGPAILEVMTDPNEVLYPKVPPGKPYKDMILGPYIKERR